MSTRRYEIAQRFYEMNSWKWGFDHQRGQRDEGDNKDERGRNMTKPEKPVMRGGMWKRPEIKAYYRRKMIPATKPPEMRQSLSSVFEGHSSWSMILHVSTILFVSIRFCHLYPRLFFLFRFEFKPFRLGEQGGGFRSELRARATFFCVCFLSFTLDNHLQM